MQISFHSVTGGSLYRAGSKDVEVFIPTTWFKET